MITSIDNLILGRCARSVSTKRDITNTTPFTIQSHQQRIAIGFFALATGFSVALTATIDGIGAFVIFRGEAYETYFTLWTHGDLPTRRFVVSTASASNISLGMIEHFVPEEYLTAGLDEFKREYGLWQK